MKKRFLLLSILCGLYSLALWGQNKVTLVRNPEQQLPITIGLQYQWGGILGLRLGTDYTYAQKDKIKPSKNENRPERQVQTTRHFGLNFQLAHAESSYDTYILQAEHFVRKTKSKGLIWQIGYGVGVQRNQYIGFNEEGAISGRSYLLGTLQGGIGYDLSKMGIKGSVQFMVKKDLLFSGFKQGGANNVLELTYRLPLFNF